MTRGRWFPALLLGAIAALAGVGVEAQIVRQLTAHRSGGERSVGRLDDSGAVFFITAEDPEDLNPQGRYQVMRWDPPSVATATPEPS